MKKSIVVVFAFAATLYASAADHLADLVIYGSSPAAVTAAIKATDMGLKPVIVAPAQHIGGLSVSGLGFTDSGNTSTIGGLARDFYRRVYKAYQKPEAWTWQRKEDFKADGQDTKAMNHEEGTMWTFEPHVAEQVFVAWMAERKVEVHRGEFLDREKGVRKKDGRIVSIRTLAGNTYSGRYFIDATYEGDLMAAAGVPYRVGREDCAEFGERWNGNQIGVLHHHHHFRDWKISPYKVPGDPSSGLCAEVDPGPPGVKGAGDRRVQAYCYRLCLTDDPRNRIPFAKPDGYDPARYELLSRVYAKGYGETFWKFDRIANHKTDTNNHGPLNFDWLGGSYEWPEASYARREELAKAHKDYQMGVLYFIANDRSVPKDVREAMSRWGLAKDEFVENGGWPYEIYVREGRRMVGEYTMTEHDCLGDPRHPAQGRAYGSVGMGSYCLDSHNVRRYVTAEGYVQNEGDIEVKPKAPYGIDYGAIVPRKADCGNLLVPVALSATHTAFGSIRMEPVFMLLGESAATAAAFAAKDGRAVQDVDYPALSERLLADGQVLDLSGGRPDSGASVMRAVRSAHENGGGTVHLADGEYHFYSSSATNMSFHVSNHDQPEVRPVFLPFVGVTNVAVVANNAKFVMHGMGTAILVRDSRNVSFKGIAIEWEKPFFAKAAIIGFEDGKTRVRFSSRDTVAVEDGKLMLFGEDWKVNLRDGNVFDRETHEMVERTADVIFSGMGSRCDNGDFLLDVDLSKVGAGAKTGDVYVMRNGYRPHPVVCLDHAKDTTFENFVFRDGFGMGILAQKSENVTLRGGGCYPRDRGEYNSNTIDATHFSNCRGTVTVENCRFEGMMDDALNVHSTCLGIVAKPASDTIRCRYMHPQSVGFGVFSAGDAVRFIAGKTLENGFVGRVVSVITHDDRDITLVLDGAIPSEYGVGDAVENADWQCAVVFRNNTVANNRARGVLFTTPKKIVCEGNFFDHVSGSAILLAGDAQGWYESGACEDVVIRKNRFRDCLTSVFQYCNGVVSIYPEVKDLASQKRRYHRNIKIEDNDIETFDVPLLYALSAEEVVWRNNRVTKHDRYRGWGKPDLIKVGCGNVEWQ